MSRGAKTKVLQLIAWGYPTQESSPFQQITLALPPAEYEVTHAYLRSKAEEQAGEAESKAAQVKYFGFSAGERGGLRLSARAQLRRFCEAQRFDVVIGHGYKPTAMLLALNRRRRFRLCIGIAHRVGRYDRLGRRLTLRLLTRSNCRFVGVSDSITDYLLSLNAGFTAQNTRTISNAIDIDAVRQRLLARQEARQALGLPAKGFIFGSVGRFDPVKEHLTLIRAFHTVSADYPNACIALIGGGKLEAEYRRLIAELGLEGRVFIIGRVDNASRYLRAYDVFALPSLSEGLSIALLEAMAAALPLIGSDARAIKQVIAPVAEIFPRGEIPALAAAMRRYLAADPRALEATGAQVLALVRQNHSIAAYRERFRDLIASRPSP